MVTTAVRRHTCARCGATNPAGAAFCARCGAHAGTGPVIAGYAITRVLGRGGASVVYLARQELFDREVAIKLLRHDVDEAKVWARFLREARAVGRLSGHPNVLTVHAAGRSGTGEPYLVTEYLDQGSLGDVIAANGPLPVGRVARVGVAIADALLTAHGVGVLHRDVKPGNVLLGRDGRVKLGDFGIARLLAGRSITSTDVVAFTPEHVAPEILRGDAEGPWSDVYGLASTLATALVGGPLFRRRPDERMESMLTRKLMAPAPLLPASLPMRVARLLTSALDPEPSRRPSLDEFRRELATTDAAPVVPPPAVFPAPVRALPAVRSTMAGAAERDAPDVKADSFSSSMRRRNRRRVAMLAFVVAFMVTLVAAGLFARLGDRGEDASSTTSGIFVVSTTTRDGVAQLPSVPTTGAPTASTAATAAAPVVSAASRDALAVTTPQEAETFVRGYYEAVAAGNYDRSWAQLAPEFQSGMARSYDYYVDFWDRNDVEVGVVELVGADDRQAIVDVELRWNGSRTGETDQFTLVPDVNGDLRIVSQTRAGN